MLFLQPDELTGRQAQPGLFDPGPNSAVPARPEDTAVIGTRADDTVG